MTEQIYMMENETALKKHGYGICCMTDLKWRTVRHRNEEYCPKVSRITELTNTNSR